jgi:hypothetical protein
MTDDKDRRPQALSAVLSQKNIEITGTLVFEDESIIYPAVKSVSMRGAQREITGMLVANGYVPAGRWTEEGDDEDGFLEFSRTFKPGPGATVFPVEFAGGPLPQRMD